MTVRAKSRMLSARMTKLPRCSLEAHLRQDPRLELQGREEVGLEGLLKMRLSMMTKYRRRDDCR